MNNTNKIRGETIAVGGWGSGDSRVRFASLYYVHLLAFAITHRVSRFYTSRPLPRKERSPS